MTQATGETPSIPWPDEMPVMVLWPDAADVFGISKPTCYSLAGKGEFPGGAFRVGARWFVRTADLREALGLPVHRSA
jgi:hypothetical protein